MNEGRMDNIRAMQRIIAVLKKRFPNLTTDETNMSLNLSSAPPGQDQYAIYIEGLNAMDQYVNSTYALYGFYSQNLNPDDNEVFDICLLLGNLSANHTLQTTTIFFQGSQV